MRGLSLLLSILLALCGASAGARGQSAARRQAEFRTPDRRYEFTSLVSKLRSVKQVTSRTPGFSPPGEFYLLSEEMLRHGSAGDFERLAGDENPVVRVMGLVCLAQADPVKSAAVLPLHFGDKAAVRVGHNCVIDDTTVGEIARRLLSEPDFLGHQSERAGEP